jgi:hypothetical protein
MNDQEAYDKICLLNNMTFNAEPIDAEGYVQGLVSITAPQIVTGMMEELVKEFEHCWFDGTLNRLVIG